MRWVIALLVITACAMPAVHKPTKPAEEGLWTICYDDVGRAELHEDPTEEHSCKEPSIIRWPALPVKVHLNEGTDTDTMLRAFDAWEGWLGRPVFELTAESGPGVVEITYDPDPLAVEVYGIAAIAPHRKLPDGSLFHWVIFFGVYRYDVEVAAHELGHVLGLSHDRKNKRSIMYPGKAWYLPSLSPNDKRILCNLYGC